MKRLDHQKELTPVVYGESSVKLSIFEIKKNDRCFRTHWHDRFEILRIMRGDMKVFIGEDSYIAPSDSLVIINPCQPHSAVAGENGAYYYVVSFDIDKFFNLSAVTDKYLKPIFERKILFNTIIDDDFILAEVDMLISNHKINPLCAVGNVYMILGKMINKKLYQITQNTSINEKFNIVTKYINDNYNKKITTAELSKIFGYNESYLCRKFKECTGLTISSYINILRLEQAKTLLEKTNKSVQDISVICGFDDLPYFSRNFKKHFFVSPNNYRKLQKSTANSI